MLTDKDMDTDLTKKQVKQLVDKHRKQYDSALARGNTVEAEAHMKAVRVLGRKAVKMKEEHKIGDKVSIGLSPVTGSSMGGKIHSELLHGNGGTDKYGTVIPKGPYHKVKTRLGIFKVHPDKIHVREEVTPMIFNDQPDVAKLNELLEDILAKPFQSSFVAVQAIRAALDLFGITLPKLEIEQDAEKPSSIAALTMLHAGKRIPPADTDCEYAFKINPLAIDQDDGEVDGWYLYMVINREPEHNNHYDAYATIVDSKDLDKLINIDIPEIEHENPEQIGDDSGESDQNRLSRHSSSNAGDDGFDGEKG